MRPWLIDRLKGWGVSDHVTLPGLAVSSKDWVRFLSAPDVCVAPEPPTRFNSLSTITKIAEYMGMGQPVVAFNLKETRLTAGEAAVYVEPAEPAAFARAVIRLLEEPEHRAEMVRHGRERVRQSLCWESQEPRLLAAYDGALQRPPNSRDGLSDLMARRRTSD